MDNWLETKNLQVHFVSAAGVVFREGKVLMIRSERRGWEFPGGKIEAGETPSDALVREIKEELDTTIIVGELIDTIEYDYPSFHLSMDCFFCTIAAGRLLLKEHEAARWLTKEELSTVDWLPADVTVIDQIAKLMD